MKRSSKRTEELEFRLENYNVYKAPAKDKTRTLQTH